MIKSERKIYQISELTQTTRALLEKEFGLLWVEGEISSFSQPRSGHWYFTLKDDKSQIRCVMFRGQNKRVNFTPEEGLQVLIRCRVSLYEARGEFQAVAENMEVIGDGALRLAFEQLYKKLRAEGLFDDQNKRPIPKFPDHIGVITSPTGAALQDVLTVLGRRYPVALVSLIPASTQGNRAPDELICALTLAEHYNAQCRPADSPTIKTLIFGRGGGAPEDLQAFNDECLARALAKCEIPVVTGIGHETDLTIADFVADLRAPTPSAAAEMTSPDQIKMCNDFLQWQLSLRQVMQKLLIARRHNLQQTTKSLRSPQDRLQHYQQRLDELRLRSKSRLAALLAEKKLRLQQLQSHLKTVPLIGRLTRLRAHLDHQQLALQTAVQHRLQIHRQRMREKTVVLNTLSPLTVLGRGYAVITQPSGIVTSAGQVTTGQTVTAFLKQGALDCKVAAVHENADLNSGKPTQPELDLDHP